MQNILDNFLHHPILFFVLGLFAVFIKPNAETPFRIVKLLSLYLLFHIGIKGDEELFQKRFNPMLMKAVPEPKLS